MYLILKIFISLAVIKIIHLYFSSMQDSNVSKKVENVFNSRNIAHINFGEPQEIIDFEDFDHIQGAPYQIVPNIVHLLFLNKPIVDFYHMVNIFSIFYNHGPDKIYFHCDNCSFSGKYFDSLKSNDELWNLIVIHPIPFHKTIFGKEYGWINFHR